MKKKARVFNEDEIQKIKDYYESLGEKTRAISSFEEYAGNKNNKKYVKTNFNKLLGNWNRIRNKQEEILSGVYEDRRIRNEISNFKILALNRLYIQGDENVNIEWLDKKSRNAIRYRKNIYYKFNIDNEVKNLMHKIDLIPREDFYNLILTDPKLSFKSLAPYTLSPFTGDIYDDNGNKITKEIQEDIKASYGIEYNSNIKYGDEMISYLEDVVDNYLDLNKDYLNLTKTETIDVAKQVTLHFKKKR